MKSINNPLNIRYSPNNCWHGQIGHRNGFVHFDTNRSAIRAAFKILHTYWYGYRLKNIRDIITRWAPSVENPTDSYIEFVCVKFSEAYQSNEIINPLTPLGSTFRTAIPRLARLLLYMADYETPGHGIEYRTFLEIGNQVARSK